ncbi:MAG: hypothetical protein JXO44_06725 [Clostridia bacterium]|nr:hypothetical protein [Clostridia bacterium]
MINIYSRIDKALKIIWSNEIIEDYNNDYLLKEDTMKNAVYYHLRNQLGDGYFNRHRLRIFTEYELEKNKEGKRQRGDIVIVKLKPKSEVEDGYNLSDRVEEVVAIIELKFKIGGEDVIKDDVFKMRDYIRSGKYENCQYYLGIIYEREYSKEIGSWLTKNQSKNWAQNRLTELTAHYDEEDGQFISNIISYTNMNIELNTLTENCP